MAVQASAIWRIRPNGSNTNGGGFDPGLSGAGNDYSQQNAAQATGTNGVTTGTTTFTDSTANAFTATMVGNAMYITGTGQTTGWYFVTAYTSASAVTLDRSPGTGTGATWNLGGAWGCAVGAPFANLSGTTPPVVNLNTIYILGSGVPNPSSYTYDYVCTTVCNIQGLALTIANDPATPGYKAPPDTTGGMPCIQLDLNGDVFFITNGSGQGIIKGLYFVANSGVANQNGMLEIGAAANYITVFGCVIDQFGKDVYLLWNDGSGVSGVYGCEGFSSVSGSDFGNCGIVVTSSGTRSIVCGCNFHDCTGLGYWSQGGDANILIDSIIAKCANWGIQIDLSKPAIGMIKNCTIDGNGAGGGGGGIVIEGAGTTGVTWNFFNNIVSNHTAASNGYGINAQITYTDLIAFMDYNTFYNNNANYVGFNGYTGPHDTFLVTSPYVGQSTENYTLA